jgi:hypothetical protein
MSSASVSIIRTYAHHRWRIVSGLGLGSVILRGLCPLRRKRPEPRQVRPAPSTSRIAATSVRRRARLRAVERAARRRAAVRVAEVRAGEPARAGRRRSPTLHAATASPWMPGVTATKWQSDTCAVRDRPAHPLALAQLVAIDDRARNTRHVEEPHWTSAFTPGWRNRNSDVRLS